MTLCMAAICQQNGEPRIVTCTDWKATTEQGSAENTDKFRGIKRGLVALKAGKATRAEELVKVYRRYLRNITLTNENVLDALKRPVFIQLRKLKEEYCRLLLKTSYSNFQNNWTKNFPSSVIEDHLEKMEVLQLGASLILAGFIEGKPLLCRVDRTGELLLEDNFAAIGEGRSIAAPALMRRDQNTSTSIGRTIYHLFEAKSLAEILDSVGGYTSLDILYPGGTAKSLSTAGYNYFIKLYKKYAPPSVFNVELKKQHFSDFDYEDEYGLVKPHPKPQLTARKSAGQQ